MKRLFLLLPLLALLSAARAEDGKNAERTCRAVFASLRPGLGGMQIQLRGDGANYMLLSGTQERPGVAGETLTLRFGQGLAVLGKAVNIRFTPLPGGLNGAGFYVETGFTFGNLGGAPRADQAIVLAPPGTSVRFVPPDLTKAAAALQMPK